MKQIDTDTIHAFPYPRLIEGIREAFTDGFSVPGRNHYTYPNPGHQPGTLLLMPAWNNKYLGVKLITISPDNSSYDLPSIQGSYNLFDVEKGLLLAQMDAKALTTKRTAATSAMAAGYLTREDAETLLMVGTGALAPELIRAHNVQHSFKRNLIWGRDPEKAGKVAHRLAGEIELTVMEDLDMAVGRADLITVATLSTEPLIRGRFVKPGTHIDLVGAYRGDMRESDDELLRKSHIVVDTISGATSESGELRIPLSDGILSSEDIAGELHDLCNGKIPGRTSREQVTCFKSSGHAIEDLVAAQLLYES